VIKFIEGSDFFETIDKSIKTIIQEEENNGFTYCEDQSVVNSDSICCNYYRLVFSRKKTSKKYNTQKLF